MKKGTLSVLALLFVASGLLSACGSGSGLASVPEGTIKITGKLIDRQTRQPIYNGSASDQTSNGGVAVADLVVAVRAGDEVFTKAPEDTNDTSTSTSGDKSNLFNEQGTFSIDVPVASTYEIRVMGTGYASYAYKFVPVSYAGSTANQTIAKVQDLGNIPLVKSVSMTVRTVDLLTGAAVTGATVYATVGVTASSVTDNDAGAAGLGAVGGDNFYGAMEIACTDGNTTGNLPEVVADAEGAADGSCILTGLNPLVDYDIIVTPTDTNADGIYDYVTAVSAMDEAVQGGASSTGDTTTRGTPTTLTIALSKAENDDTPTIVASSCGQYSATEDTLMASCATPASGALRFVFNYPLQDLVAGQLALLQNDEATFTTDDGGTPIWGGAGLDFNADSDETDAAASLTVTSALSAGNTVLTLTPSAALTANGLYSVRGTVTASVPGLGISGNITSLDFDTLLETFLDSVLVGGNTLIYAFADDDTSIADPTVDNYNGDDDGGAAAALCLEFDEAVIGSVLVKATTTGTTTTQAAAVTRVNLNTGSLITEGRNADAVCGGLAGCPTASNGACAASTAVKYVVPLGITLADDVAATPSTVTVYVDAMDYAGNKFQEELALPIQ